MSADLDPRIEKLIDSKLEAQESKKLVKTPSLQSIMSKTLNQGIEALNKMERALLATRLI